MKKYFIILIALCTILFTGCEAKNGSIANIDVYMYNLSTRKIKQITKDRSAQMNPKYGLPNHTWKADLTYIRTI